MSNLEPVGSLELGCSFRVLADTDGVKAGRYVLAENNPLADSVRIGNGDVPEGLLLQRDTIVEPIETTWYAALVAGVSMGQGDQSKKIDELQKKVKAHARTIAALAIEKVAKFDDVVYELEQTRLHRDAACRERDEINVALAACGIAGIYDAFTGPADAITQMAQRIRELEAVETVESIKQRIGANAWAAYAKAMEAGLIGADSEYAKLLKD